jgi:hypothetical protein
MTAPGLGPCMDTTLHRAGSPQDLLPGHLSFSRPFSTLVAATSRPHLSYGRHKCASFLGPPG